MKYCQKCGKELVDEAIICPGCGCAVSENQYQKQATDSLDSGYTILGFLLPIVGLILYIIKKDTTPLKASSAGKGALIGFLIWFVFYFFVFVISLL